MGCVSDQLLSYQTHQILKFLEQKPTLQTCNIYVGLRSEYKGLGKGEKLVDTTTVFGFSQNVHSEREIAGGRNGVPWGRVFCSRWDHPLGHPD